MIDVLGDRKNTGFCLECGTLLLQPYNDYQCCSECTKKIEANLEKYKRKRKKKKKMDNRIVVHIGNIKPQVAPIGVPTK